MIGKLLRRIVRHLRNPREHDPFPATIDLENRRLKRLDSLETWRKESVEDSRKSQDQFDRALMTLSASGIGATLAFLDKIVPFQQASLKWLLFLIWVLWGACLLVTVFSFYASNKALLHAQNQISEEWRKVRDAADPDDVEATPDIGGCWNTATKVLNELAALLFVLGLLAMMAFIGYNLLAMPNNPPKSKQVMVSVQQPQSAPTNQGSSAGPNTKGLPVSQRPPITEPTNKDK